MFGKSWPFKNLRDLMWCLYDDPKVIYPLLMTAAHKAKSEYDDRLGEGAQVKSAQAEVMDEIATLREQIIQLQVAMQKLLVITTSDHVRELGNRKSKNQNVIQYKGRGSDQNQHEKCNCS